MANRISIFSKEYIGLENSKGLELLREQGIENKKARSNLSEEEEGMLISRLASLGYRRIDASEAPKGDPKKEEMKKPPVDAAKTADAAKPLSEKPAADTDAITEKTSAESPGAAAPAAKQPENNAPTKSLKKKNVIIVSGDPQNRQGGRSMQQGDRRGQGAYRQPGAGQRPDRFGRVNGPIKPRENMVDRAAAVTNRMMQEEKRRTQREQEVRQEEKAAAAETREAVEQIQPRETQDRNYNPSVQERSVQNQRAGRPYPSGRQGEQRPVQGGGFHDRNKLPRSGDRPHGEGGFRGNGEGASRSNNNRFGGGRPGDQRGFQRPGARPGGKPFAAEAPITDSTDQPREEGGNDSQAEDKRNKKDRV